MIYSIGCIMIAIGRPLLAERFVLLGFPIVHCMFTSVYGFCDYMIMFSSVSNKAFLDDFYLCHQVALFGTN